MGDLQRIHPDEGKPRKRPASPWAVGVAPEAPEAPRGAAVGLESMGYSATEMLDGYRDGCDANSPAPSDNRSRSYRHGFANARDDLKQQPRATAERLRRLAQEAADHDGST